MQYLIKKSKKMCKYKMVQEDLDNCTQTAYFSKKFSLPLSMLLPMRTMIQSYILGLPIHHHLMEGAILTSNCPQTHQRPPEVHSALEIIL